ncbi:hypothetical protein EV702DRAFT_1041021 [Suillus placidus]|uniref:Uncharacterized protein n=1 Tax=Suillus placidus TaxID=48579 RepID=A0A9P7D8U9_9AGAM|nr:hypothetical protein EV702DRAFT_1041021 [Suillus placidus]
MTQTTASWKTCCLSEESVSGQRNFHVQMMGMKIPWPATYGNWQELVHPLGGTYYYHNTKNAFTPANLKTYLSLHNLENFIDAPSEWNHKRLELEAQYWKHLEFFLHQFLMECSEVRRIRRELACYIGELPDEKTEATTLGQSSAASMFWTLDQMNQIGTHLATIGKPGLSDIHSLLTGRILYILHRVGHHQFLNRHNQPEARLVRSHAVREKPRSCQLLVFMGSAAAMMLCMPITIGRIRSTSVDGILNGVEVNSFVDDFSSQAKSQVTLAGVSMAMDIAILAIPGLGTTETSQILCSCSLLFGVGCIFAGTIVQHFAERMRSMDFASYYLRQKTKMFIIITGIPTSFCVLRITGSVMGSILGFFSGVVTDFKPSAPLMIMSFITLGVVVASLFVLVLASYGPGPARRNVLQAGQSCHFVSIFQWYNG